MLHLNELPFRALIENLDGPYTPKNTLSGDSEKQLNDAVTLDIADFVSINSAPVAINENVTLSTDQNYLLEMCDVNSNGYVSKAKI